MVSNDIFAILILLWVLFLAFHLCSKPRLPWNQCLGRGQVALELTFKADWE